MMKRSRTTLLVLMGAIALSAWAMSSVRAPVKAQSAALVLCDRVAADPSDPDKPANVKGTAQIAPSDIAIAIKFCKRAAARSRRALYELGRAYEANRQYPAAIGAFRKAAAKGSSAAMVELGVMLGTGVGVAKNVAEARALFARANKAGNARAATNLAALDGSSSADPVQTRALLAKAAAGNSAEAEFQLGLMAAQGTGGPKDDALARSLFEKAAAQGNVQAMIWAGAFAEVGRGGPKSKSSAKAYYQKAAALGSTDAKTRLKRIECPYVLKDKHGKIVTDLCF